MTTEVRFLDGQSLGASATTNEMTPFVGIESFFLPADVDSRLGASSAGQQGPEYNPLGGDVWW